MGSGGSQPLSVVEQKEVLYEENMLAMMRDREEREFLVIQESQRVSRDKAQRLLTDYEERSRVKEITRLEEQGALASEGTVAEIDVDDRSLADLYAALSAGVDEANL
jgi:hypothetical protein